MGKYQDLVAVIGIGLVLGFVIYTKRAGGLGVLNGRPQVPTTGEMKLVRTEKEVDNRAQIVVDVGNDRVVVPLIVRDNQLYGPKPGEVAATTATGEPVSVSLSAIRYRYIINPMLDRLDVGAWAGRNSIERDDGSNFDVGLRLGVVRLFDDILAVDLVANDHVVGAGLSLHLPPDRFPGFWNHVGIGWARVVGFGDDGEGDVVALSFSTR